MKLTTKVQGFIGLHYFTVLNVVFLASTALFFAKQFERKLKREMGDIQ